MSQIVEMLKQRNCLDPEDIRSFAKQLREAKVDLFDERNRVWDIAISTSNPELVDECLQIDEQIKDMTNAITEMEAMALEKSKFWDWRYYGKPLTG
jgi:hypothetical protein